MALAAAHSYSARIPSDVWGKMAGSFAITAGIGLLFFCGNTAAALTAGVLSATASLIDALVLPLLSRLGSSWHPVFFWSVRTATVLSLLTAALHLMGLSAMKINPLINVFCTALGAILFEKSWSSNEAAFYLLL